MTSHEYLIFYSVIANLVKIIDEYEKDLSEGERKTEALPDSVYNWLGSFSEEANTMEDAAFQKLMDYLDNSLNKNTEFHKRLN